MTWKDKLEIGLEEDAPFRKDNLPDEQVRGEQIPAGEGRSPEVPAARQDADEEAGISKERSTDEAPPSSGSREGYKQPLDNDV